MRGEKVMILVRKSNLGLSAMNRLIIFEVYKNSEAYWSEEAIVSKVLRKHDGDRWEIIYQKHIKKGGGWSSQTEEET